MEYWEGRWSAVSADRISAYLIFDLMETEWWGGQRMGSATQALLQDAKPRILGAREWHSYSVSLFGVAKLKL